MLREEEETDPTSTGELDDIGDKMKPGDDTRTVAYASYLQFLSKLEKTQNYRIVGKFVKQKYAQAKDTNEEQAKKLKEVYYILTYYANMKDYFDKTIGEESKEIIKKYKPKEKNLIDRIKSAFTKQKGRQFSLLSDVSPHIALATKAKMLELINMSKTLKDKIENKGVESQHINGFHDKMEEIRNMDIPAETAFTDYLENFVDPNPTHKQTLKNLRIAGIAVAELFGPLVAKPKGYLNYLEKDVFKIKPPDAPTVPDTPARVDLDRPDTADFSRFLSEGLRKSSAKEKAKSREVRSEFFKADEEAKRQKFFDMIMSLEYNITTKFKILNNKDFEKINDIVKTDHGGSTLLNYLKEQMLGMFGDAMSEEFRNKYNGEDLKSIDLFRIFLEEAVEEEERIEKDTAREDQTSLQRGSLDKYIEIYKEFKFVAAQKEAGEVDIPNTVRFFFNKSVSYYSASKIEEDNPEKLKYDKAYRMYEYAHTKAEPNWKKVRAKIAERKIKKLKQKDHPDLYGKYEEVSKQKGDFKNIELHKLEKEYQKVIAKSKDQPEFEPKPQEKEGQAEIDYLEKVIIPYLGNLRNPKANTSRKRVEREIERFRDKTITFDKLVDFRNKWMTWYDSRTKKEPIEEQLTKILAPYLMERIKNRKPIDNRLINMLKPLKANKRKRK